MSTIDYTNELPTSFDTARIRETLVNVDKRVASLVRMSKNISFTSSVQYPQELMQLNKQLLSVAPRQVRLPNNDKTATGLVGLMVDTLSKIVPVLQGELNSKFNKEVSNVGLTYNKVNFLRMVELVEFASVYMMDYYLVLTALIINRQFNRPTYEGMGPDDLTSLKNRTITMIGIVGTLTKDATSIEKLMDRVPDILVAEDDSQVAAVVGASLDPMGFANLPWPLSVVYNIRLGIADTIMNWYEYNQETEATVDRRVLLYKQKLETGEADAALEKSLSVQETRLLRIKRRLEKMEGKYGL